MKDLTTNSEEEAPLGYVYKGPANTAEWIVENPTLTTRDGKTLGALADFRHVTFSNLKVAPRTKIPGNKSSADDISMRDGSHGALAWPTWSGKELTVHYQ